MPAPTTADEFLRLLRRSELVADAVLDEFLSGQPAPAAPEALADLLVRGALLTPFQTQQLLQGKWRGFRLAKYRLLERIGGGGMGQVFLCEHVVMRRPVAVKVLPQADEADDPTLVLRFQREARAGAVLDHPNIVRVHDIDEEDGIHFLVQEYIDGTNLHDLVKRHGPLAPERAANYVAQVAAGLQHAHEAGIIHRDIKPANILLDRQGVARILDMGLARLSRDPHDNITDLYHLHHVLGTVDYMSPEQATNSGDVDNRVDVYSLGATCYYLLTGRPPFHEGTTAQKLLWHQYRTPEPVTASRPDVPPALSAVVERMLAKDAAQRYQSAADVVEALEPWTRQPPEPPSEREMPQQCPAVRALLAARLPQAVTARTTAALSPVPRRTQRVPVSPPATTITPPAGTLLDDLLEDSGDHDVFRDLVAEHSHLPLPSSGRRTPVSRTPPRPVRRRRVRLVLFGVALLALAFGIGWLARARFRGPEVAPGPAGDETPVPGVVGPVEAGNYVGRVCTVEMKVQSVNFGKNNAVAFVNSESDWKNPKNFTILLNEAAVVRLTQAGVDVEARYKGRTIRVTGKVELYKDRPEIVVSDPDQRIQFVD